MGNDGQYLTKRKDVWHYQRRVPNDYAHLDTRGIIRLSTKIKIATDRTGTKASRVAARINETNEAFRRGLAESKATESRQAYADAVKLARSLGLDYQPPQIIAQQPIAEVLERIETAIANGRIDNPGMRKAIFGGVEKPEIKLSTLFSEYGATQRTKLSKMSPNQQRKWINAKKRAVEILIEQKGDKPLHELSRDDALSYADWWEDRIVTGEINAGTANAMGRCR